MTRNPVQGSEMGTAGGKDPTRLCGRVVGLSSPVPVNTSQTTFLYGHLEEFAHPCSPDDMLVL